MVESDLKKWTRDKLKDEVIRLTGLCQEKQHLVLDKSKQINELYCELDKSKCEKEQLKSYCECLKKEVEDLRSADKELIDEPIRIAEKLIYATRKFPISQIQKAFGCKEDTVDIDVYSKSDLHQIAKHLLVYCDLVEGEL